MPAPEPNHAPLQVIDGNYERMSGVCPWWDAVKRGSRLIWVCYPIASWKRRSSGRAGRSLFPCHVRFSPESGHRRVPPECPL